MWNEPSKERLSRIPKLYETEHVPLKEKVVHLHLWFADTDWYVIESDGEDLLFGYAVLNGDYNNSEWGYVSLAELRSVSVAGIEVDCELETYWEPKPAKMVAKICRGMGWDQPSKERGAKKGVSDGGARKNRSGAANTP